MYYISERNAKATSMEIAFHTVTQRVNMESREPYRCGKTFGAPTSFAFFTHSGPRLPNVEYQRRVNTLKHVVMQVSSGTHI
jgi:hypothetical protein